MFKMELLVASKHLKVSNFQVNIPGFYINFLSLVSLTVDCTWAGRGNLSVNIKTSNDSEVTHCIKEISTGVYLVSYKPKVDSPHYIDVRYNDHQAPGCPQMVEIRDPTKSIIVHGPALKSCVPEEPATFLIETGGFAAAKNFDVIVTDPNGSPLNIKCYQQKDGSLLAEFTPQRTGKSLFCMIVVIDLFL